MVVRRFAVAASLALVALTGGGSGGVAPAVLAAGARCDIPAAAIPSASGQRKLHRFLDGWGNRPTGGPAQQATPLDLEQRPSGSRACASGRSAARSSGGTPGAPRSASAAPRHRSPLSGPSGGTPAVGATAPLVAIPDEQPITAANAAGRIVVRPAPAGAVPLAAFTSSVLGLVGLRPGPGVRLRWRVSP